MHKWLTVARAIDTLNERVGRAVLWLVLVMTLVSAGNAVSRYALNTSSNAWLELQWYLFAAIFLLAAGYTLKHNGHVRIDLIYGHVSPRTQAWIDLVGAVVALLPLTLLLTWLSWSIFTGSFQSGEMSSDAGGLIRWPVRLLSPLGFGLLALQGLSELIKRIAFLCGHDVLTHEKPTEEV